MFCIVFAMLLKLSELWVKSRPWINHSIDHPKWVRITRMIILMLRMIRMIILMLRMIILMGQDDGFPTPPHPKWRFRKYTRRSQSWAFPVTGQSHGLAAAAPGHSQEALVAKKVARTWTGAGPGPGGPDPAPLSAPPARLGHGLAPLPPGHGNAQ